MADSTFKLFGFEISRAKDTKKLSSIVPPRDDDGAGYVTATSAGSHFGHYVNMDGDTSKDNAQLILKIIYQLEFKKYDISIQLKYEKLNKLSRKKMKRQVLFL